MKTYKLFVAAAVAAFFLVAASPKGEAQISVGVNIGPAPVCPYGYYDYAPYACAPYGYYGPEWFSNGVFIGTGPWFHGPASFHGHVDSHFDPHHGYKGPAPHAGDHPDPVNHVDRMPNFHGNEMHDAHGHVVH
jgi:hypothetical protein